MTFLNPIGLIGMLSLPIIVIFHLLRERQRRYVVSHLDLWSFLDTRVRGPRTRRIPITRILLLDLLIAALISLAWSKPSLAIDLPGTQARHLVIVLDVSTSMLATDGALSRFAHAQADAATLVEGAGKADVVTVLTFGRHGRLAGDSRDESESGALAERILTLQAGETGGSGEALLEALALGQARLERSLPAEFHIFTDGGFSESVPSAQLPHSLEWHWLGGPADNQAVIDINATQVGEGRLEVFGRIANFGDRAVSRRAVLSVGGRTTSDVAIDIPPNSSVVRVWHADHDPEAGPSYLTVALDGRDALPEDDSASIGLQAGGSVRVALAAENPAVLEQAVRAIPNAEPRLYSPTEYSAEASNGTLDQYDLTIIQGFQPPSWPGGEVLLVGDPVIEDDLPESNLISFEFGSSRRIPVDAAVQVPNPSPIVDGIDFSGVRWLRAWRLEKQPPGFITLLQAGENPLMLRGDIERLEGGISRVAVLLADLSQGNFTKHPAFPILIANLVEQARRSPVPEAFKTGEPAPLPPSGSYSSMRIVAPQAQPTEWMTEWQAEWKDTLRAGLYRFEVLDEDGRRSELITAANAGDGVESDLRARPWTKTAAAIEAADDRGGDAVNRKDPSFALWPWLLVMAVMVLIGEARLAWRN